MKELSVVHGVRIEVRYHPEAPMAMLRIMRANAGNALTSSASHGPEKHNQPPA